MTDIYHYWGGDLVVSASGDLQVATVADTSTQQILRALMTNPALQIQGEPAATADYADHPDWGAGLPRRIGSNLNVAVIQGAIRTCMYGFPSVARTPAPTIDVQPFNNGASIDISYYNLTTGETETLSFDIGQ
jgi:hypothetical protein